MWEKGAADSLLQHEFRDNHPSKVSHADKLPKNSISINKVKPNSASALRYNSLGQESSNYRNHKLRLIAYTNNNFVNRFPLH